MSLYTNGQTNLNISFNTGTAADISTIQTTSDGSIIVLRADGEVNTQNELYSIPASGGSLTRLNGSMVTNGDIIGYQISSDNQYVVFTADRDTDNIEEIYSVPIGGGSVVKLNTTFTNTAQDVNNNFTITSDSDTVIFRVDQDVVDEFELYSVPITGGVAPTQLNPTLVSGGDVEDFAVTNDGARVIYLADQETAGKNELYIVPVTGGTVTKLNDALAANRSILSFEVSPNDDSVVWRGDAETDNVFELFASPVTGGADVKLNGSLVSGGTTINYQTTYDGTTTWVVYRAIQLTAGKIELFSVPILGGTSNQLNVTLPSDGEVVGFLLSPDGSTVAYNAYQDTDDEQLELFTTPINGGSSTKVNGPLGANDEIAISNVRISPIDSRIIFIADDGGVDRLYSNSINGGDLVELTPTLVSGGDVTDFEVNPVSGVVTYLADQDNNDVFELYTIDNDGGASQKLHSNLTTTDISGFVYSEIGQVIFNGDLDGDGAIDLLVDESFLPVLLTFFKAHRTGDYKVHLNWATALEVNNKGFIIQKSPNGIDFEEIGFIEGNGNSNILTNYSFEIVSPFSNYYRLKQIDYDEMYSYSPIVYVEGSNESTDFNISPNPTTQHIHIFLNMSDSKEKFSLSVIDLTGRRVFHHVSFLNQIENELNRFIPMLPRETYIVILSVGKESFTQYLILK